MFETETAGPLLVQITIQITIRIFGFTSTKKQEQLSFIYYRVALLIEPVLCPQRFVNLF